MSSKDSCCHLVIECTKHGMNRDDTLFPIKIPGIPVGWANVQNKDKNLMKLLYIIYMHLNMINEAQTTCSMNKNILASS